MVHAPPASGCEEAGKRQFIVARCGALASHGHEAVLAHAIRCSARCVVCAAVHATAATGAGEGQRALRALLGARAHSSQALCSAARIRCNNDILPGHGHGGDILSAHGLVAGPLHARARVGTCTLRAWQPAPARGSASVRPSLAAGAGSSEGLRGCG